MKNNNPSQNKSLVFFSLIYIFVTIVFITLIFFDSVRDIRYEENIFVIIKVNLFRVCAYLSILLTPIMVSIGTFHLIKKEKREALKKFFLLGYIVSLIILLLIVLLFIYAGDIAYGLQ